MAERACCARWCRRGTEAWQRCPGAGRHQISRREATAIDEHKNRQCREDEADDDDGDDDDGTEPGDAP